MTCALVTRRQVEAEEVDEVTLKHSVPSVPYFLFFKARGRTRALCPAPTPCRLPLTLTHSPYRLALLWTASRAPTRPR